MINSDDNSKHYINQIILITDGDATSGETDLKNIFKNATTANINNISIFSFGITSNKNWVTDLDHSFLKLLSTNNHGFYKRIRENDTENTLNDMFKLLSNPLLKNIKINYKTPNYIIISELTQQMFDVIYKGNDIIICGKISILPNNNNNNSEGIISSNKFDLIITGESGHQSTKVSEYISIDLNYTNNELTNIDRIHGYWLLKNCIQLNLQNKKIPNNINPYNIAMKYEFITPWTSMIIIEKKVKKVKKVQKVGSSNSTKKEGIGELKMSGKKKPGMGGSKKPGFGKKKPQMTRIKTVWITKKTAPFPEDYQVGGQIGEPGQFGKAYRCRRRNDGKIFAVKSISKARFYRLDRSAQRRQALLVAMQGEIDIMRRLKHDYIVRMEAVYEDKHTLYIVMEECKGGELFDRIRARQRYKEKDAKPVIRMMLDALFFMHELHRVVHCDLKPDNILFVTKAEDSPIKIIDFGMSKVLPRLRSLRELCGTPYYTAPEIIQGAYAHGADMWSVGMFQYID